MCGTHKDLPSRDRQISKLHVHTMFCQLAKIYDKNVIFNENRKKINVLLHRDHDHKIYIILKKKHQETLKCIKKYSYDTVLIHSIPKRYHILCFVNFSTILVR